MAERDQLTTAQVAAILGVSKRTLKTWLGNGKVAEPARNPDNDYRIWKLSDVEAIRRIIESEKKDNA